VLTRVKKPRNGLPVTKRIVGEVGRDTRGRPCETGNHNGSASAARATVTWARYWDCLKFRARTGGLSDLNFSLAGMELAEFQEVPTSTPSAAGPVFLMKAGLLKPLPPRIGPLQPS
jgi:hypothetical protein